MFHENQKRHLVLYMRVVSMLGVWVVVHIIILCGLVEVICVLGKLVVVLTF